MSDLQELYFHDISLQQLKLDSFRGFGNVTLEFLPDKAVTVLVADNGSGKSSALDAIAEFLNRFYHLAIVGKSDREKYQSNFGEKDILNGRNNSTGSAVFNLTYPFPDKKVFEIANHLAHYLDDNGLQGHSAGLAIEEEAWVLHIFQGEHTPMVYFLPDEFQAILDGMVQGAEKILDVAHLNFDLCKHDRLSWVPNLSLTAKEVHQRVNKNGSLELQFQLTRGQEDTLQYEPLLKKSDSYKEYSDSWNEGQGFIEEWLDSLKGYNWQDPLEESQDILPLLVYYGGSAINIRYDNELKLPYRPGKFQAYSKSLIPERFDFEEFLTWALWVYEKQPHAWALVQEIILDVLNADQRRYIGMRFETQRLLFEKQIQEGTYPILVEVSQLSSGEKSIVALIGDLVKRAIQLNPILLNINADNPLAETRGIVLIDEIDLHLHPRWQRIIVPKLRKHFPEIQFIVTTHSPLTLQEVDGAILFLNNFSVTPSPLLGGWKIEEILRHMGVESLKSKKNYEELVEEFYDYIKDSNIEEAEKKLDLILKQLPQHSSFRLVLKSRLESLKEDW